MSTNQSPLPKRVHVVGICGVATSALAVAFKKKGILVTGSDKGFFPPVSTELEAQGVPYYAGWHPEKMFDGLFANDSSDSSSQSSQTKTSTFNTDENIVIVGTASGSTNPETAFAREKGLSIYSFAEAIGKYFVKEQSIVCVGTWGKTSSSALLSFILEQVDLNPTYMFGGISLSHESSAKLTDSTWNVFEGDEYKSSPTDLRAKFFHYKPSDLLLTAVSWDHADLYPNEAQYFEAFSKLLAQIPRNGSIIVCRDHMKALDLVNSSGKKYVTYGRAIPGKDLSYSYKNVRQTKDGLDLTISNDGIDYQIHSPMLGLYQSENITGCFAMACEKGIQTDKIIKAITLFKGLKRRMEKRLDSEITVIDDIAHSPEKAASVLQTLKSVYLGKIIAIFEPNSGGRSRESIEKYNNAFENADIVIIPRLTKLKLNEDEKDQPMEGDELVSVIKKTHPHVEYIDDDKKLIDYLVTTAKTGDIIAFLGSHGFRGMIEETVNKLQI